MAEEVPTPRPLSEAYPKVDPERVEALLEDNTFIALTQMYQAKALFEAEGDPGTLSLPPGVAEGIRLVTEAFQPVIWTMRIKLVDSDKFWIFKEIEAALAVFNGEVVME